MINTQNKSSNSSQQPQMVAGLLPEDSNIEFCGVKDTQTVIFIQNGKTFPFSELPNDILQQIENKYLSDTVAQFDLACLSDSHKRQLELYTYYMFGDIDSTPDVINGKLQEAENFRETSNCKSLQWSTKDITIDGYALNTVELKIIDFFNQEYTDKHIAMELEIAHSYLDFLKRKLFKNCKVSTKVGLVIKAKEQGVI